MTLDIGNKTNIVYCIVLKGYKREAAKEINKSLHDKDFFCYRSTLP
jgi:hypothetical protein